VVASADHLKKDSKLEKKVILVVTDGEDNESSETLEQAVRRLQADGGPTVYAIGILEKEEHPKHAKRALQIMSERRAHRFLSQTLDEVDAISRTVAHDIRVQYTIGYKPTTPKAQGGYRQVKVEARAHGYGKLSVRTKSAGTTLERANFRGAVESFCGLLSRAQLRAPRETHNDCHPERSEGSAFCGALQDPPLRST